MPPKKLGGSLYRVEPGCDHTLDSRTQERTTLSSSGVEYALMTDGFRGAILLRSV